MRGLISWQAIASLVLNSVDCFPGDAPGCFFLRVLLDEALNMLFAKLFVVETKAICLTNEFLILSIAPSQVLFQDFVFCSEPQYLFPRTQDFHFELPRLMPFNGWDALCPSRDAIKRLQ